MDYDADQVLDFICLQSQPNCIVLLLNSGIVHHCVFIPYTRSLISGTHVNQTAFNATFESTNVGPVADNILKTPSKLLARG
jgi:hypothetical protein